MPKLMSSRLSRNRIFEVLRVPTVSPEAFFCVTVLYCMPPSPNEIVPQTFGKM